jgi:hypothetical protein
VPNETVDGIIGRQEDVKVRQRPEQSTRDRRSAHAHTFAEHGRSYDRAQGELRDGIHSAD